MIGSGDFFDFDITEQTNTSFFTQTDIKSVLGKNIVLNFIDKMNFELKLFDFSETALKIAEFYEEVKNTTGIVSFFQNPVIQMILYEIEDKPYLKKYLYERIFGDIEQDKIKCLDNTFKNNEEIYSKTQEQVNKFVGQKAIYEKQIKKIMKDKKCDRKTAELIYENEKLKKIAKKSGLLGTSSFPIDIDGSFGISGNPEIKITKITKVSSPNGTTESAEPLDLETEQEEIVIDDSPIIDSSDDEEFWS